MNRELEKQSGYNYGVRHLRSSERQTLINCLVNQTELRLEDILPLCELGAIYINELRYQGDGSVKVNASDVIRIHTTPRRFIVNLEEIKNRILFNCADYVVVNKPAGLPVHAIVDNHEENLLAALREILNQDVLITHRLDIPTSGVMVFAKNSDFQSHFNKLLQTGRIKKIYQAMVDISALPSPFQLSKPYIHFMEKSPRAPKVLRTENTKDDLRCELSVLNVETLANKVQLLDVHPLTGRTHQIRAQLGALGSPILGDISYGSQFRSRDGSETIALQSSRIEFSDLNEKPVTFSLPNLNFAVQDFLNRALA